MCGLDSATNSLRAERGPAKRPRPAYLMEQRSTAEAATVTTPSLRAVGSRVMQQDHRQAAVPAMSLAAQPALPLRPAQAHAAHLTPPFGAGLHASVREGHGARVAADAEDRRQQQDAAQLACAVSNVHLGHGRPHRSPIFQKMAAQPDQVQQYRSQIAASQAARAAPPPQRRDAGVQARSRRHGASRARPVAVYDDVTIVSMRCARATTGVVHARAAERCCANVVAAVVTTCVAFIGRFYNYRQRSGSRGLSLDIERLRAGLQLHLPGPHPTWVRPTPSE